ncbi:MAG: folylpolyglutamate synthase/dihydrofolate synthase family protein [Bacteroidales bacterium]
MTYQDTLDYLFARLPMFQRSGPAAYKANLDNTLALSRHLQQPEKKFRSIHIAGTNGKGSVAHMIASILQEQGYKTGLATSPHLKDFRERIKIDGQPVPESVVTAFVKEHKAYLDKLQPSFFEATMAMTFDYFANSQVDIAVVETGLGGRLDSSNILTPELSVITNIGYDHAYLLGPGLEDIAREKAGIIKPNIPVVIGRRQPDIHHVFEHVANEHHSPLYVAGDIFSVKSPPEPDYAGKSNMSVHVIHQGISYTYCLDLLGDYQADNLLTALTACKLLNDNNVLKLYEEAIKRGLQQVVKNTGLMGRWQFLGEHPTVICDTGHNADAIQRITKQLQRIPHETLRIVLGMMDDKDRDPILELLPPDAIYYFCCPDIPRGLAADQLLSEAAAYKLSGKALPTVKKAFEEAISDASFNDLIFVGGSTFVVSEVL